MTRSFPARAVRTSPTEPAQRERGADREDRLGGDPDDLTSVGRAVEREPGEPREADTGHAPADEAEDGAPPRSDRRQPREPRSDAEDCATVARAQIHQARRGVVGLTELIGDPHRMER